MTALLAAATFLLATATIALVSIALTLRDIVWEMRCPTLLDDADDGPDGDGGETVPVPDGQVLVFRGRVA